MQTNTFCRYEYIFHYRYFTSISVNNIRILTHPRLSALTHPYIWLRTTRTTMYVLRNSSIVYMSHHREHLYNTSCYYIYTSLSRSLTSSPTIALAISRDISHWLSPIRPHARRPALYYIQGSRSLSSLTHSLSLSLYPSHSYISSAS